MQPPMFTPEMQARQDREHLRILAIFHFVVAGLAVLGVGFVLLHYTLMSSMFAHPELWKQAKKGPNHLPPDFPKYFMEVFVWFYVFFGACLAATAACNLLSGVFLLQRKYRMFSLVVAGLDCLQVPFGTILGVFTIIVLLRDSVRQLYEQESRYSGQGF